MSAVGYCPDQEMFIRLVSELAVAMAPPADSPARTIGPRALQLNLDITLTSIEAQQSYWALGTEGDGGRGSEDVNTNVPSFLVWNRLAVRKGLPFGFEVGATLGQGVSTSLWSLGLALKWALFEGFRTGLGRLPDVSVQAALSRSVGSSQASVRLYAIDFTLSKPFVVAQTWSLSPFAGVQALFSHVDSGVIDITPGSGPATPPDPSGDAYAACNPKPGHRSSGTPTCAADGSAADFAYNVVFDPVSQTRVRAFLGAQARYQMLIVSLSTIFDLAAPALGVTPVRLPSSSRVARQAALNFAVGVVL